MVLSVGIRFARRVGFAGLLASCFVLSAAADGTNELGIARQALRDGLWDVAIVHADKADGDAARQVILECLAKAGRWGEIGRRLDGWGRPAGEPFVYFGALAEMRLGDVEAAGRSLARAPFTNGTYRVLAAALRAQMAAAKGDAAVALKTLREAEALDVDEETRMFAAGLYEKTGEIKEAEKIWREVIAAGTNAGERAFVTASINLSGRELAEGRAAEAAALARGAVARSTDAALRREAGFRLGEALVAAEKTFEEGSKLVRRMVQEAPDAPGARAAFFALGEACLGAGKDREAADLFRDAIEMWPDAAKHARVHSGRGWALSRLGRHEEALAAFERAFETAEADADRALALLKQGDELAETGRGDEAMAMYREVVKRFPDAAGSVQLRRMLAIREMEKEGRELYRAYKFAEAGRRFADVAAADPSRRCRMAYFSALCLYGQGRDDEAEHAARVLADSGSDPAVRAQAALWLGKFLYNRGRWSESAKLFSAYAEQAAERADAPQALVWSARAAFAANDFALAIQTVGRLAERYPKSPSRAAGLLVQGESLIELARFDEAVLVLERVAVVEGAPAEDRLRAAVLKADALFAMGADNPTRYDESLETYRAVRAGETLPPGTRLAVSFKIGRTLEKLKRTDEAIDTYYTDVVLAYREGRQAGLRFDDDAKAAFSRAAFRLADEYESRGKDFQATHVLELVVASDVPAAAEAERRIDRIHKKGKFL